MRSVIHFCCACCVQEQPCQYRETGKAAECSNYEEVPQGNEKLLAYALFKHGPVAVGIDATLSTFQLYSKGQTEIQLVV